jgi:hypothetical protein
MRLLNTSELYVREFYDNDPDLKYAILSHTWDKKELSLPDLTKENRHLLPGFKKVKDSCDKVKDRYEWIWIDTCCIDKTSSAELSEAINSMYRWYEDAGICYVYLSDFHGTEVTFDTLSACRWFSRGWTLQELVAPSEIIFCNADWIDIGSKIDHIELLSTITGIHNYVLDFVSPQSCNIAQRMSWASNRNTTREEDMAYCLLGLFDVHLPPIYGEGAIKAFMRLQEEILKRAKDHTIFLWTPSHEPRNHGLLATSPKPFCKHKQCHRWLTDELDELVEMEDIFDPYELLRPAEIAFSKLKTNIDGFVIHPPQDSSMAPSLMDYETSIPSLGPQGLHISLLLPDDVAYFDGKNRDGVLHRQPTICVLDLYCNTNADDTKFRILLPLYWDVAFSYQSQYIQRRGQFSRLSSNRGEEAPYQLKTRCKLFRRQTVCISQQEPIPLSSKMVTFRVGLSANIEKVDGWVFDTDTHHQPQRLGKDSEVYSRGGMLYFVYNCSLNCGLIPFYVSFGLHGRKITAWCCIHIPRKEGELSFNQPEVQDYKYLEEHSSYFRTYSLLRICKHYEVVGIILSEEGEWVANVMMRERDS